MKTITILSGRAMIVELPEGAQECNEIFSNKLWCFTNSNPDCRLETMGTDLPEGNWQIVGRLSELTEVQVAGIVEGSKIPFDETQSAYRDYTYKSDWGAAWLPFALESLDSAIRAENWTFENQLGTYEDNIKHGDASDFFKAWLEAQSRVLDRSRCLLLRRVDG